jgi:hypothetical protein
MIRLTYLSSRCSFKGGSKMRLNLNQLHLLLSWRNLLVMGLGVYWCIVFLLCFGTHADKTLGDREMMKCMGGQAGYPGSCTQSTTCADAPCQGCQQVGALCNANAQVGYTAEYCNTGTFGGGCSGSSVNTRMLCLDYFQCDCRAGGCVQRMIRSSQLCISRDVGNPPCKFTQAPPGC